MKNDPHRERKIKQLKKIILKYRKVFRADTGCVTTNDYKVYADINLEESSFSTNKQKSYIDRMDGKLRQAICDKFDFQKGKEIAKEGIKLITNGLLLSNILPNLNDSF